MLFGRRRTLRERICDDNDALVGALFADASCAVAAVDRMGCILRASAQLCAFASAADRVQPGAAVTALFDTATREAATVALLRVSNGGAPESFVARLPAATVRVSLRGLVDISGVVEVVLLRAVDISPLLLLEQQVALSRRMQEVGQLTGGVAHDFNNLLTALIGAADAIAARTGLDDDTRDDIVQILASARRGADLVRQLQAFGRQQTLQPRALSVNPAIATLADMLRRLLGSSVRLRLELEDPGRAIHIDPTQFDRVLMNLTMNAHQAMASGGVLTLRSQHATVLRAHVGVPDTVPPGRYVMVDVEDTGCGVSPEMLEHIFEPFFTTRREAGGTGLGLSTVHGIVRQSGGYLTVESMVGQGTRMRLHLPRWNGTPDADIPTVRPAGIVPAIKGKQAVLLVEDEAPVLRLAARALARDGWSVLTAPDGEAALALVAAQSPVLSAVVTDMMMPGIDGATLVCRLRELPGLTGLPAILVSGYAKASLRESAAISGTVFMAKPYDMRMLAARLAELVSTSADEQAKIL